MMYPTIDWQQVTFYDRLPWFFRFARINALVVPAFYSKKIHVYLNQYLHSKEKPWTQIIVHESMHLLQYQFYRSNQTFNAGFMHRFVRRYFAYWLQTFIISFFGKSKRIKSSISQKMYLHNPFEKQAYQQEYDFVNVKAHFIAHEIPIFLQLFPYLVRKHYYMGPPLLVSRCIAWFICFWVQCSLSILKVPYRLLSIIIQKCLARFNKLPPSRLPYC